MATTNKSSAKAGIQQFERFLSGMVMPNIGVFIAWGLITALFIPTGWMPNAKMTDMVGPMITYLLPLLIAYTGGKLVWGMRGGVVGSIATMGVIRRLGHSDVHRCHADGALRRLDYKKSDQFIKAKDPVGFEMLVDNLSAGILGMLVAIFGFWVVQPVITVAVAFLQSGVNFIISAKLRFFTEVRLLQRSTG